MVNRVFGNRYQVTEKIGMGGMAEVYKATDSTLGRTVAIKVMLPQYAADENFAARFRQEAQAAANLNSPYIVNIYDWGKDADSYYIVMEYVRGTDLKTAIQQRGHIHPRKVAEIGSQVCSALAVAHTYDIIHRDIKSANIMVKADGNVKVMDFGIAQAGKPGMTTDSSVLGTAHYVSPEQAQGKTLTPASDLYSLGVVMYEASTGQLPFDGPDVVSVAMKQVSEQPVPPRQINPDIDPALEQIIMKAMSKDPMQRYSSATEMKHAIDDYLRGNMVNSAATQVLYDKNAGATSVMNPTTATATATDASKKKKKSKKKIVIAIILIAAIIAILVGVGFATGAFGGGKVTVPDVTGQTLEEATSELEDAGLEVGITYESSDEAEENIVISQDPAALTKVEKGSTVNITVSSGEEEAELVEVPNLSGLTASDAEQQLSDAGLVGQSDTAYSDEYEAGEIFDQDPAAFTEVAKGSTVTYTISLGEETAEEVNVPDVIGLSAETATSTLENRGFQVAEKEISSDYHEEGEVADQSPEAGTTEPAGSTITIYVSTGPDDVEIPDVTGMSYSEARSTLKSAGFQVSKQGTGSIVMSYSPTGTAESGTKITVTLGNPETDDEEEDTSTEAETTEDETAE